MSKQAIVATSWKGPLPPPATLEAFKRISPSSVDTILKMAVDEAERRHANTVRDMDLREKNMNRHYDGIRRGQIISAIVLLLISTGATLCAIFGDWRVGCALAGFGIVNLTAILIGRKS